MQVSDSAVKERLLALAIKAVVALGTT